MILTPTSWTEWKKTNKTEVFLENVKKGISKIFIPNDNLKTKVEKQIAFIKRDKPFQNIIGNYKIEDLSKENAKSWTAFKAINNEGKQYKLRATDNMKEAKQMDDIIEHNKFVMPDYLWKQTIEGRTYYLFKRLYNANTINTFDYKYQNEDWNTTPEEINKKVGKVLGKVNSIVMHNDWSFFTNEISKRLTKIKKSRLYRNKLFSIIPKIAKILNQDKKIFSNKEIEVIKNFLEEHMKNSNIKFGYDLNDAHEGNFMIGGQNPDSAYAIDEGSIKKDNLIGEWIGNYINEKNITEEGIKKLLKGYYKKNPDIVFDKKYFELIYLMFCLRKIWREVSNNKNIESKVIQEVKEKLLEVLEYTENETYICKISALNKFVEVNKKLRKNI